LPGALKASLFGQDAGKREKKVPDGPKGTAAIHKTKALRGKKIADESAKGDGTVERAGDNLIKKKGKSRAAGGKENITRHCRGGDL